MLKDSVEQSPIRVAAGVSHNQHLEGGCHQELQHIVVMPRFKILHRLDILQQLIVIPIENVLIVLIKFITIAKDNVLWVFEVAMNEVVFKVEIIVILGGCCVIEAQ